jgi:hypothetical protein
MDCRQSTVFHFRCPSSIRVALKDESNRQLISPSAYARRAIIRSLQVDGAIRLNLGETVADKAVERFGSGDHVMAAFDNRASPAGVSHAMGRCKSIKRKSMPQSP